MIIERMMDKRDMDQLSIESLPIGAMVVEVIPAMRALLSNGALKILKTENNTLIEQFIAEQAATEKMSKALSADFISNCKSEFIYIDEVESAEKAIAQFQLKLKNYTTKNGFSPRVIVVKGIGVVAVGDNAEHAMLIQQLFQEAMKTVSSSADVDDGFSPEEIKIIEQKELVFEASKGRINNKVSIVTGAAQGFGEGIARIMKENGGNIVVADLNDKVGAETANSFNEIKNTSKAIFVQTNVADIDSLQNLVFQTVCEFGGIDVFVSNAGILRAGGLDEMTPENFDLVTKINYNAYFYCTKAVAPIMKLQNAYNNTLYADVIQINSKSGLAGSKRNFAYAGGKFGGIGLTQSFALELAPERIKVNSVCPGNFYEGPLWSDPVNGLFVQYLNAGKVPGAKTIDDVKAFYLAQVPLGKGCSPADVTKAVFYCIDQENETGQAIPVSGGQIMLN